MGRGNTMATSQELFEELHEELCIRGLMGASRRLEQYRAVVLAEHDAQVAIAPALTPPPQPAVAAGFPEGAAPVVSEVGQVGLSADAPQPTAPIA